MADYCDSLVSPAQKLYNNETETIIMSPTSILDTQPFSCFRNPFWSEPTGFEPENKIDSKSKCGVGLGIFDSLVDENKSDELESKPERHMVLFGSHPNIQIPPLLSDSHLKTRDSSETSRVFEGCLSASEIELSEEYTRVIWHGPHPKTTHIFHDCIIESSYFTKQNQFLPPRDHDHTSYPSDSFLSFCFYCQKDLVQGKDIYMFRGERAFCSRECRYQGMLLEDDGIEFLEAEDIETEKEKEKKSSFLQELTCTLSL